MFNNFLGGWKKRSAIQSELPNLRKMETVMLLEEVKAMKEIATKIKEGWEVKRGKTQDCSEDINNRLHIVCVSFVLERMGGAHSE